AVRGDFDISPDYELIQLERPTTGYGLGFELFIMGDTPQPPGAQPGIALQRTLRVDGKDIYLCSHNTTVDGKRRYDQKFIPAAGKTGRLRMTRRGGEVTLWAAEDGGEFRELCRYNFGPEDIKMVRSAAHPGIARNAVDLRIA